MLFVTDSIQLVQRIPYQGFGDLKIGGKDYLVLLAREEKVL
jgi:hypothetical protein